MTTESVAPKKPRGRPETRTIKLDAAPEQAARAIFSAAPPPDPKRRIPRRNAKASS